MSRGKGKTAGQADRQRPVPREGWPRTPGDVFQRGVDQCRCEANRDKSAERGLPPAPAAQNRDQAGNRDPEEGSIGGVAQPLEAGIGDLPLLARQAVKQTPVEGIKPGYDAQSLPADVDAAVWPIDP